MTQDTLTVNSKSEENLRERIERRIKELDERIKSVEKRKSNEEIKDIRVVVNTAKDGVNIKDIEKNKIRSVVRTASKPGKVAVIRDEETGIITYQIS